MRTLSLAAFLSGLFGVTAASAGTEWEQISDRDGIKTFRKEVPGTPFLAFRGDATVDAKMSKLLAVSRDSQRAKEYVAMLVDVAPVQSNKNVSRVWQHYDLPWPVSDRDYALERIETVDDANKAITVVFKSVEDPQMPLQECCIRAVVTKTFWRFTAMPDGKVRIECEIITDPKGSLPAWMANMVQKDWAYKTILGTVKQSKKPDIGEATEFASW